MRQDEAHPGYEYLGNGPAATGDGTGWSMSAELAARCGRCGDFVSLDPMDYANAGAEPFTKTRTRVASARCWEIARLRSIDGGRSCTVIGATSYDADRV